MKTFTFTESQIDAITDYLLEEMENGWGENSYKVEVNCIDIPNFGEVYDNDAELCPYIDVSICPVYLDDDSDDIMYYRAECNYLGCTSDSDDDEYVISNYKEVERVIDNIESECYLLSN